MTGWVLAGLVESVVLVVAGLGWLRAVARSRRGGAR